MSSFKVEIGNSEFFFSDDQMQIFFSFIVNIRLANHIRTYIKKTDFRMGEPQEVVNKADKKSSDSDERGDPYNEEETDKPKYEKRDEEDTGNLYSFQSSQKVDSNLVPTMPSKIKIHFKKTKWNLKFNAMDLEPLDYYNRLKHRKFFVVIEQFSISSRAVRKGNILYPFSYEIKLDINMENMKGNFKNKAASERDTLCEQCIQYLTSRKICEPCKGILDPSADRLTQYSKTEVEAWMEKLCGKCKQNVRKENLCEKCRFTAKTIFDIKNLNLNIVLKVSKRKGFTRHDRLFSNEMTIGNAEIYMNPACLLFYKFVTLFQVNYANYNFAYYKEYLTNYLKMIRKSDKNATAISTYFLRKSIAKMSDSNLGLLRMRN